MAEPLKKRPDWGPYLVLTCIGSGAMGTVHEAIDTRLGRTVALKRLHPHIAESPGASERFLREGQAAARIRHPHVVQVLALGNEGGTPFLAMERLDGRSLASLLESCERLSVPEALDFVLPVIAAIAAAHDAQVIHRDLKPSNVFVERGPGGLPWPKVLDFGVSAIVEENESSVGTNGDGVVGTIAYLPPEQARGQSGGSFAGDQYSLAVLLYECVTGAQPFTGATVSDVLRAIASESVVPPSEVAVDIPARFDAVVARAMSRDPVARFSSVRHFGAALLPLATDRARAAWSAEFLQSTAADSEIRRRRRTKKAAPPAVSETVDSVRVPPPLPTEGIAPKRGAAAVQMYDGLAMSTRGDAIAILWKAPARLHRSRWLFDQLDRIIAEQPEGVLTLMVILPTSAPPDRATSIESARRLIKIRSGTRRAVVVILGDSLWQSMAKGILRVFMPSWGSSRLLFAGEVDEGIAKLARAASPRTPKAATIQRDVRALYAALDPTLANEG